MTSQRNVAEFIIDQLAQWGVKNIFGIIGDSILYFIDALAKQNSIKFYQVRHEESAALMASAHAKLTGETGICISDGGPGTLHLLNGLADAFIDCVPVIAITGQVSRREIGTNAKQYVDQQSLMRPIVSYTALLSDQESTAQLLESAYRTAAGGRTTAHISIPMDIFPLPCSAGVIPPSPFINTYPESSPEVIIGAMEMIKSSLRPVILAGAGSRSAGELVSELASQWGAAIISTLPGTGVVDSKHPLYAGGLGHAGSPASEKILKQADLCLVIGANWWPSKYVPANIPIIQIDRTPTNIGSTTPVSYGIVGESGSILDKILGMLDVTPNLEWIGIIKDEIQAWLEMLQNEASGSNTPVHPASIVKALQNNIPEDAVICLDTGDHAIWFGRVFRGANQRVIVSGKWRTMGFALPAALAACINAPGRKVIALAGDGGFTMTMQEFLTAVRYSLPITVVVFNNSSLATEKNKMTAGGLDPAGTYLNNPDFASYATNCGGLGIRVKHQEDLDSALLEAINSSKPTLVDIITDSIAVPGTTMP
ncbi:MAG: thiamine pyrophosphate-binding protein [Bacillota bacterium]